VANIDVVDASMASVPEGVEHAVASIHPFPEHLELTEHRLVGDEPPLYLFDRCLDPE
jgi:hypothetical protein